MVIAVVIAGRKLGGRKILINKGVFYVCGVAEMLF